MYFWVRKRPPVLAQQKPVQAVAGAELILAGALACSHQVAQCFVVRIGNPNRRQVAGAINCAPAWPHPPGRS